MTNASAFIRVMLGAMMVFATQAAAGDLSQQQKSALFHEAQQAYDSGMEAIAADPLRARQSFAVAASRFQRIVDEGGANGPLLYNLANSYLQCGDLGRAILNYRRAERLMPADASLINNLHYARSLCRSQIKPTARQDLKQALLGWHERTPLRWRFTAFTVLNAALWLSLAWLVLRSSLLRRWLAATLALAWLVVGASVGADLAGVGHGVEAVVLADDVIVRKGNGVGFEPKFDQPLHAGVELRVLEQRGDWLYIKLANGEDGWIESTASAMVG